MAVIAPHIVLNDEQGDIIIKQHYFEEKGDDGLTYEYQFESLNGTDGNFSDILLEPTSSPKPASNTSNTAEPKPAVAVTEETVTAAVAVPQTGDSTIAVSTIAAAGAVLSAAGFAAKRRED